MYKLQNQLLFDTQMKTALLASVGPYQPHWLPVIFVIALLSNDDDDDDNDDDDDDDDIFFSHTKWGTFV